MIDDQDAIKKLKSTEKSADSASKKLGGMVKGAAVLGTALIGVGAAAYSLAGKIADTTSAISDSSKRVGMSAENYQKWGYAAKQSGVEAEKLESLMKKQQTVFADAKGGAKAASLAYSRLGVDITKIGTSSEAFDTVIERLAGMEDANLRNELANDIFGKSYADLMPLLAEGADGIKKLKDEAVALGGVMSNESVEAGDKLGDTLDKLQTVFSGLVNKILIKLMPAFQKIADWILSNQDKIVKFTDDVIRGIGDAIGWVMDNADWLVPSLKILLGAFMAFQAVSAINAVIAIFNALLLANPIGIFLVAAAALIGVLVLLYKNWDKITASVQKSIDKTLEFFGLKKPSIYSKTNLDEGGNAGAAFGGAKGGHWATGGIFTKPTFLQSSNGPALVGEAGMEAVLPISKLPGLIGDTIDYGKLESAFRKALNGQRIIMDEDGFATFVDNRIVKAGAY